MKRAVIILLVAFFAIPFTANAQIRGLLRDRAVDALRGNQQQEEPQTVDEPQQEREPERQRRQKPNLLERRMMQAMGLNNVKFDPQYNFTSSMTMEIENVDPDNNRDKVTYTTFFNPDNKNFAMMFDAVDKETGKAQKSTMVFDFKNLAMLIINEQDGERSGIALALPPESGEEMQEEIKEEVKVEEYEPIDYVHPLYTPTGRSKSIAGFNCREFVYSTEEGKVELWATSDKSLNLSQAYGHMHGLQGLATGGLAWGMGMVMEMVFRDNAENTSTHMLVKDIQPNSSKTLDVSSYNIIGIGGE